MPISSSEDIEVPKCVPLVTSADLASEGFNGRLGTDKPARRRSFPERISRCMKRVLESGCRKLPGPGADRDRMAAVITRAIDEDVANSAEAHFAGGGFLRRIHDRRSASAVSAYMSCARRSAVGVA